MGPRRYVALNPADALKQIRTELGPEAVVLSNREVAEGVEIVAIRPEDLASMSGERSMVAPNPDGAPFAALPMPAATRPPAGGTGTPSGGANRSADRSPERSPDRGAGRGLATGPGGRPSAQSGTKTTRSESGPAPTGSFSDTGRRVFTTGWPPARTRRQCHGASAPNRRGTTG